MARLLPLVAGRSPPTGWTASRGNTPTTWTSRHAFGGYVRYGDALGGYGPPGAASSRTDGSRELAEDQLIGRYPWSLRFASTSLTSFRATPSGIPDVSASTVGFGL